MRKRPRPRGELGGTGRSAGDRAPPLGGPGGRRASRRRRGGRDRGGSWAPVPSAADPGPRRSSAWVQRRRDHGSRPGRPGPTSRSRSASCSTGGETERGRRTGVLLTGRTLDAGHRDLDGLRRAVHRDCAQSSGCSRRERICFVSDGAASIRWIRERAFPERDRAARLVPPRRAAALRGRPRGTRRSSRTAIGAAVPGDVEALLAILRGPCPARSSADDPEQALRCRAVIGYVDEQPPGHRQLPHRAAGQSSGPMEKGVDIVICRRFKTRGMSWFRRGVSHLLHLRLLRLNGTLGPLLGRAAVPRRCGPGLSAA